uniref:GTP-binding protein Rhes n=1 Tax=Tetranychus urticae TaxID=32264 RepID=T1JY24_TETUR
MPSHLPSLGRLSSTHSEGKGNFHIKIVVLGSPRVGKTAIVSQFLYSHFPESYIATVDQLHRAEYEVKGFGPLILDILDTSGSHEFPVMKKLAIESADAFLLVFSLTDSESFEEVRRLRDEIIATKKFKLPPIVVAANKCDLDSMRVIKRELTETIVTIDWENGYVESSAKDDFNINTIFQQLMVQIGVPYKIGSVIGNPKIRRKSLPAYPTSPALRDKVTPKRNSCAVS